MKRSLFFLLTVFVVLHLQGQSVGSWNILSARAKLAQRWSLFGEAQLRSTDFYRNFFYYEVKGGVNFRIDDYFNVLAGTGRYITYQDSGNFVEPIASKEWRIWQELGMKKEVYRLFFEHRYRVEERFYPDDFRMRFRYRLSLLVPLNHPDFRPNTVYLVGAEELFLTNKAPYFERNRLFVGAGYKFKPVTLQAGWMNQFDYKLAGSKTRNFFQIMALFELDFSAGEKQHAVPTQLD